MKKLAFAMLALMLSAPASAQVVGKLDLMIEYAGKSEMVRLDFHAASGARYVTVAGTVYGRNGFYKRGHFGSKSGDSETARFEGSPIYGSCTGIKASNLQVVNIGVTCLFSHPYNSIGHLFIPTLESGIDTVIAPSSSYTGDIGTDQLVRGNQECLPYDPSRQDNVCVRVIRDDLGLFSHL